ncbi:hypothetical protein LINPERPRIM_LOCUS5920, partial [Linum perenne]
VTINTDGLVIDSHYRATTVGIIRDHVGRRLSCFAANLSKCSIIRVELRATFIGSRLFGTWVPREFISNWTPWRQLKR